MQLDSDIAKPTEQATNLKFVADNAGVSLSGIWTQWKREVSVSAQLTTVLFLVFMLITLIKAITVNNVSQGIESTGMLLFFLFVEGCVVVAFVATPLIHAVKKAKALARGSAFAAANNFTFVEEQNELAYPGVIFTLGADRKKLCEVSGQYRGQQFSIFNYSRLDGNQKKKAEYIKGVIVLKLPRAVPNMVLDAKANNTLGLVTLGALFKESQRYRFEGDFNERFDAYVPADYEQDVLYFMTPELMQLLVDKAKDFDVETVDDNLFFYAKAFSYKQAELTEIFKVIDTAGKEFVENTRRYTDERAVAGSGTVAEGGKRLKRGIFQVIVE